MKIKAAFAAASMSVTVAAVVAACSDLLPRWSGPAPADAAPEARSRPPVDEHDACAWDLFCHVGCGFDSADLRPIVDSLAWKPAIASPDACAEDDIAKLLDNARRDPGCSSLPMGMRPSCVACVFSRETDPSSQPFVVTNGGQVCVANIGACFARLEGAACGKAAEDESLCEEKLADCASNHAAADAASCADFVEREREACPALDASASRCASFLDMIRTLCGPPPDAGPDAGDAAI